MLPHCCVTTLLLLCYHIAVVIVRVLGSLLSAHLLIMDKEQPFGELMPTDYNGELLEMAHDLGLRLLPAFDGTSTGIPHPRVLCDEKKIFLEVIVIS